MRRQRPLDPSENRQTYSKLFYHIVFSTRRREPTISKEWRLRLHDYIGGTLRGLGGASVVVGGVVDHIHILAGLKPAHRLCDIMREVKSESSRWIHDTIGNRAFAWQEGYSVFTVSPLACERVKQYILDQAARHSREGSRP